MRHASAQSQDREVPTYHSWVPLLVAFVAAGGPVGDELEPMLRWEFVQH